MSTPAELNAIRKLPENQCCADCGVHTPFGHQNVVVKFRSFVCGDCKSAHQAYSHRVKSVTMSNWTKDEIDELKPENGGSNTNCQRVWLSGASSFDKPRPGDPQDRIKAYVVKAYIDEEFKGRNAPAAPAPSAAETQRASPLRAAKGPWGPQVVQETKPAHISAPAPEIDLLGGDFSSTPASSSTPAGNPMDDLLFGGGVAAPTAGSGLDLLGSGSVSTGTPSSSSGFGFMGAPAPGPGPSGFGFLSGPAPAAPPSAVMRMPGASSIGISFMQSPGMTGGMAPQPRPVASGMAPGGFGQYSPIVTAPAPAGAPKPTMSIAGGSSRGVPMKAMNGSAPSGGWQSSAPDKPTDHAVNSMVAGLGMGGSGPSAAAFKLDLSVSAKPAAPAPAAIATTGGSMPSYSQTALAAGLGYAGTSHSGATGPVTAASKAKLDDSLGTLLPFSSSDASAASASKPKSAPVSMSVMASAMAPSAPKAPVMMAPQMPMGMAPGYGASFGAQGFGAPQQPQQSGFGFPMQHSAPATHQPFPGSGFSW